MVLGYAQSRHAWLIALAAAALLVANAAWQVRTSSPERLFRDWRYWDDVALASGYAARGEFPVAPYRVRDQVRRGKDPQFVFYRSWFLAELGRAGISPIQFWRTLPSDIAPPGTRWRVARRFDDRGRALLTGAGFKLLQGLAPFLPFWLAVLAALPVLAWAAFEFAKASHPVAGAVFLVALACSAFVRDLLLSGYSPAGFHLVALLALVPLATYAVLGQPKVRGLLLRAGVTGLLLAVCILCRATGALLLPGYAVALFIGAVRAGGTEPRPLAWVARSAAVTGAGLCLLFLPYLGLRLGSDELVERTLTRYGRDEVPQYHDPAVHLWTGLGDFDRTKGYSFRDKAVEEAIIGAAGRAHRQGEVVLRDLIWSDIRADPLWYAGILVKRVAATVTLYKLWPWAPLAGTSIVPALSVNEGATDNYYSMLAQADWIGLGPSTAEVPIVFVLAPTALLLAAAFLPGASPRWGGIGARARQSLPLLACTALAVLPTPVLITTATAFETECFVVVHFLALAFLVESVILRGRGPAPSGARDAPPG